MRSRLAVTAAVGLALLGACSSDTKDASASSTTTAADNVTTTTIAIKGYVDQGDYVTGRHIGLITAVDAGKRTFTIDIEQFLTGPAAINAYKEDGGDQDAPDNDYYVRNQSKQLRTFAVATSPEIHLQSLGRENGVSPSAPDQGRAVTFADFSSYFKGDIADAATHTLFWITLEDGVATRIEEQFVP